MANKKLYFVETRFTFTGTFKIKAKSKQEAMKMVEENCGLVLGGNIHSDLNDEDVDWDFNTHPEKQLVSINNP